MGEAHDSSDVHDELARARDGSFDGGGETPMIFRITAKHGITKRPIASTDMVGTEKEADTLVDDWMGRFGDDVVTSRTSRSKSS